MTSRVATINHHSLVPHVSLHVVTRAAVRGTLPPPPPPPPFPSRNSNLDHPGAVTAVFRCSCAQTEVSLPRFWECKPRRHKSYQLCGSQCKLQLQGAEARVIP